MRQTILLFTMVAAVLLAFSGVVLAQQDTTAPDRQQQESTTPAGGQQATEHVPSQILVKFDPGASGREIAEAHRRNGGQEIRAIQGIDVRVVRVPERREQEFVERYEADPRVEFAELDGVYQATYTANDPRLKDQWQYNNTTNNKDADIDAAEAWNVNSGSGSVAIAVLDTGIDQSHEDLKIKIKQNKNFSSSGTVDDKYGHGTHVAGSAAAATNNSTGVAATCPDCSLYNVKVLGDTGSGSDSSVANGITWSADNGAKVVNMSLGGGGSNTLQLAVNYAWGLNPDGTDSGKRVVLAAAAGNDDKSTLHYPAAYDNVIAVASTDKNDVKSSFSNYGSWVDVAAPGSSILSTAPDHRNRIWTRGVKYGTISGTSMATPHVAGVAGLVWSTYGTGTSNQEVRNKVEGSISGDKTVLASGDDGISWAQARINACKAVGGTSC